jgi:hypothetical protein
MTQPTHVFVYFFNQCMNNLTNTEFKNKNKNRQCKVNTHAILKKCKSLYKNQQHSKPLQHIYITQSFSMAKKEYKEKNNTQRFHSIALSPKKKK